VKFIVQGGEEHASTGHSFVAESNYASALGRGATRVVSCNTTSVVRTLTALKRAGLLRRARGTLLRRATDPWESHEHGIMNTLVPEPEIPSHQGADAQTVDPELDVVTMAVKVPETLAHLHYWSVQMTREATKEEVLDAFRRSSRIALIRVADGLVALNAVKELMSDRGRPHDNLYEVALWADMLQVRGDEVFYAYDERGTRSRYNAHLNQGGGQGAYRRAWRRVWWRGHGASPGATRAPSAGSRRRGGRSHPETGSRRRSRARCSLRPTG